MKNFVIFCTNRTGSTLLVTLLDSHPEILCIGEAFKTENNRINHPEFSYLTFRGGFFKKKFKDIIRRDVLVCEYLDYIYSLKGFQAIGFKLITDHFKKYRNIRKYLIKNNIKVIYLTRKNLLKKHISSLTAARRNLYASKEKVSTIRINVSPRNVLQSLENLHKEEKDLEKAIDGLNTIQITYEDLKKNMHNECSKILSFLDVDFQAKLTTKLVKINPDNLKEVIENYEEVARVIENSPFSFCLH